MDQERGEVNLEKLPYHSLVIILWSLCSWCLEKWNLSVWKLLLLDGSHHFPLRQRGTSPSSLHLFSSSSSPSRALQVSPSPTFISGFLYPLLVVSAQVYDSCHMGGIQLLLSELELSFSVPYLTEFLPQSCSMVLLLSFHRWGHGSSERSSL